MGLVIFIFFIIIFIIIKKVLKGNNNDNRNQYQSKTSISPVKNYQNNEQNELGITPHMNNEDILIHLRKEYRKWNSLANHSSKDVREEAQEKLKSIGKYRSKLFT